MTELALSPPWDADLFLHAYGFAARAHGEQRMPGRARLPYAVHIGTVAMEICAALTVDKFSNPNLAVQCALLHDVLEDTDTDYPTLSAAFDTQIADGVLALTKDCRRAKSDAMSDSLLRIKAQPREVWAVKIADRITNLQPPPETWPLDKRLAYCDEAELILWELESCSGYLAERLRQKIVIYRARYCGAQNHATT